jgi:hypothetical protein
LRRPLNISECPGWGPLPPAWHGRNGNCDELNPVALVRNRAIGEALISVGSLCLLIAILASFDPRVRDQISMRISPGQPAVQMAHAESTIRSVASVAFIAARDQSIEHAPMVIFVLLAIVLFLFMLRT